MVVRRKSQNRIYSPTKQKILLLLASGLILGLNKNPKTHKRVLKNIPKALKEIDRNYLFRILNEFRFNRLVEYNEKENGEIEIVISEEGIRRKLKFDIDLLEITKPKKWDGFWRVVISDIPEKKRRGRDALRNKLKELGFIEWQKSVFVYPYACRDEIDFIVEFFELRNYVRYGELKNPTNEAELKLKFNL